ncbi:hypothetical protein Tco_0736527 [Tanacetum coccineum]
MAELQFRMFKEDSLMVIALTQERGKAIGTWVINNVKDVKENQPRVIRCYNCKGECHIAKQCTAKKREEQQDFLVDGLEDLDSDCDDLQLHTTCIFKADHVDAFDSDCDEAPTISAIFIAPLSLAGSINGDFFGPTYDSDILSKYMTTIENDAAQSVPPFEQDNSMILSIIEQMKSQVEQCNTINQENKSVNELLADFLQNVKNHLDKFDGCINYRTVVTATNWGNWGMNHIKDAYEEEVIPFVTNLRESFKLFEMGLYKEVNEMTAIFKQMENEVDQCSMEKKLITLKLYKF